MYNIIVAILLIIMHLFVSQNDRAGRSGGDLQYALPLSAHAGFAFALEKNGGAPSAGRGRCAFGKSALIR